VLITVSDKHKAGILPVAQRLVKLGFTIVATQGTAGFLSDNGVETAVIKKLHEGRPNISDAIKNREIHLVINTPIGKESKYEDGFIRMKAIQHKIPYMTSVAAAEAGVSGIESVVNSKTGVMALQDYYRRQGGEVK